MLVLLSALAIDASLTGSCDAGFTWRSPPKPRHCDRGFCQASSKAADEWATRELVSLLLQFRESR